MSESARGYWILGGLLLLAIIVIAWVWHKSDLIHAQRIMERSARMQLGLQPPEAAPVNWTPPVVTSPPVTVPTTVDPPPVPAPSPNRPAVRTWRCDVYSGYCP